MYLHLILYIDNQANQIFNYIITAKEEIDIRSSKKIYFDIVSLDVELSHVVCSLLSLKVSPTPQN